MEQAEQKLRGIEGVRLSHGYYFYTCRAALAGQQREQLRDQFPRHYPNLQGEVSVFPENDKVFVSEAIGVYDPLCRTRTHHWFPPAQQDDAQKAELRELRRRISGAVGA